MQATYQPEATVSLSERFLSTFNAIEHRLREITGENDVTVGYSQLVDLASGEVPEVRQYRDELRGLGYLRNAMVHGYKGKRAMAEPEPWVVEEIEKLERIISEPPPVYPDFCTREVHTLAPTDSVARAVTMMRQGGYSQMPIYEGKAFRGLLTPDALTVWLGERAAAGVLTLNETPISDVLALAKYEDYIFAGRETNVFEAFEHFRRFQKQGRELRAVLITEHGRENQKLLGIMTDRDLAGAYAAVEV